MMNYYAMSTMLNNSGIQTNIHTRHPPNLASPTLPQFLLFQKNKVTKNPLIDILGIQTVQHSVISPQLSGPNSHYSSNPNNTVQSSRQ
jgi:hypothetical protein